MNAPQHVPPSAAPLVDDAHPWLGLSSFTEETRAYFYGREEEVAELSRRVQRKLLSVLFGQSGLGKTSILRAGLVPRLRAQGICPVYVRIDYGPDAPSPASQIKDAVLRETTSAGTWSRAGVAGHDESLWEFFHHRDDVLRDVDGKLLTPLLIFDQFEEIFTLAQSDDAGRSRAARFVEALAELVENRPSAALEARLEEDDSAIERFDFARNDYRVLITLREDYLAHLESFKTAMPSITQNRMRLAPMRGDQALAAVIRPGGQLVTEEVAEAVVRFVAGGTELAHAQIEPSLLSLICRELNDKRIAAGRDVISLDLLAGSHAGILSDFYERALADQPPSVRAAIEDLLLTSSGYRENVAEERVLEVLATSGASPDARSVLALLVNRRLLRIEDRLDIRRVELTHDVLCGVVQQSRALRQEHEKQARAALALAGQRERELATRRALTRARRTLAVCVVLTAVAVTGSVIGYVSMRRAQDTQALADQSRNGAEALMSYLLEDFYEELRPVGQLDMLGKLTQRTIAYYDALPVAARTNGTTSNRALALVLNAAANQSMGNILRAERQGDEALAQLQTLVNHGAATDRDKLIYARALDLRAGLFTGSADFESARPLIDRAIALAKPIATAPAAALSTRLLYAKLWTFDGWMRLRSMDADGARASLLAAQAVLGTPEQRTASIPLAVAYAATNQWMQELAGRFAVKDYVAAEKLAQETLASIDEVLRQRPNHKQAARIHGSMSFMREYYILMQRQPGKALAISDQLLATAEARLLAEPDSVAAGDGLAILLGHKGQILVRLGRADEAHAVFGREIGLYNSRPPSAYQVENLLGDAEVIGTLYAELGENKKLAALIERMRAWHAIRVKATPGAAAALDLDLAGRILNLRAATGTAETTLAQAQQIATDQMKKLAANPGSQIRDYLRQNIAATSLSAARIAYAQGDFATAETESARAVHYGTFSFPAEPENAPYVLEHALSLARTHQLEEASRALAPQMAALRAALAGGSDDKLLPLDLAKALVVQALCTPGAAITALQEARALLANMTPTVQRYRSVRLWRERIDVELANARGVAQS